jgi:hypothetical protein
LPGQRRQREYARPDAQYVDCHELKAGCHNCGMQLLPRPRSHGPRQIVSGQLDAGHLAVMAHSRFEKT